MQALAQPLPAPGAADPAGAASGTSQAPPYRRAARIAAGVSLLLAGLLNGLPQYALYLLGNPPGTGFLPYLEWAPQYPKAILAAQFALIASMFFVTFGLLAIAHLCRWRAPRLTAVGTPLALWGMWGFHTILAVGFLLSIMNAQSPTETRAFAAAMDQQVPFPAFLVALAPHLLGSFPGFVLLSLAWLRSGFPRTPAVLLLGFLAWDFLLKPLGPLEPHLLLTIAWAWMGIYIIRMPDAVWNGAAPRARPQPPTPAPGADATHPAT